MNYKTQRHSDTEDSVDDCTCSHQSKTNLRASVPLCVVIKGRQAQSKFEYFLLEFCVTPQKSSCIDSFAKRADSTDVGVSHGPLGMNAWL